MYTSLLQFCNATVKVRNKLKELSGRGTLSNRFLLRVAGRTEQGLAVTCSLGQYLCLNRRQTLKRCGTMMMRLLSLARELRSNGIAESL